MAGGKIDDRACRVLDATVRHVGNLKWIRGVGKFKTIGHDASGGVIPGARIGFSNGPFPS